MLPRVCIRFAARTAGVPFHRAFRHRACHARRYRADFAVTPFSRSVRMFVIPLISPPALYLPLPVHCHNGDPAPPRRDVAWDFGWLPRCGWFVALPRRPFPLHCATTQPVFVRCAPRWHATLRDVNARSFLSFPPPSLPSAVAVALGFFPTVRLRLVAAHVCCFDCVISTTPTLTYLLTVTLHYPIDCDR